MKASGADLGEAARWRCRLAIVVVAPALHAARVRHPARVVASGADLGEAARRRRRLALRVEAPALQGTGARQPAGVTVSSRDLTVQWTEKTLLFEAKGLEAVLCGAGRAPVAA